MGTTDRWAACRVKKGSGALRGIEHAAGDEETLCGLPLRSVAIYRHHWQAGDPNACTDCVAVDAGTPGSAPDNDHTGRLFDRSARYQAFDSARQKSGRTLRYVPLVLAK